ncbi:tetratricopeptide repeat-containing hybrid sensor histidine kinase/response regulator [Aquimarina sediminis]|uniref:tetratricopeptide repeat-containing hybrid sensor histidine kinase/response regulator n=1 Tax=Aquimarina sediminis TaxID=2070536 RepID=UPI000CA00B2D|nr:ATP-binding protein [Aquimarina sediminis]
MKILKTHTRVLLLLYFNLFCSIVYAQHEYEKKSYSELENIITQTENHFNTLGRANAIKTIETIIDISEKFNSQKKYQIRARLYNTLGKIHYSNKNYKEAIQNYKIAELYVKELGGFPEIALKINNNIALVYLYGFNKPKKALKKIKYIYENSNDINEKSRHILALNLASIYIKIKKYDKAYDLLKKCKQYFRGNKLALPTRLVTTYTKYGEYYFYKRDYQNSIRYYELAASLAEENHLFRKAMDVYKKYEDLLVHIGEKDRAYNILKKYTKHHQTALEKEKEETEQYKKQLVVSEQRNTQETKRAEKSETRSLFTLSLLLLCLILFCFFIYNHNKTKVLGKSLATKNKQLEIAKDKSDRMAAAKTKFISTVSHELRTPLYGVIGLSSVLLERNKNKEDYKFIKLMKFSADHLLNLINDVLQLAKMESYEVNLESSSYNLKNLAENIKNSFEYQTSKNGNTLHLNLDSKIPKRLIGDPLRLSQIFINLISNANKFTKNGNIWLNFINPIITDDKVQITIEIKDDGRGIPLDKQETIFNKFSQADSKDHTTGTGLGLHIVKNLVELHGGNIELKSTPGKGSIFYFTIVIKIDIENKETEITNAKEQKNQFINTKDYNILIVEDNKVNQVVTQNVLKIKGYNSEIANDGLIAIDMVKKKNYDLILMDINMPNMNGIESTKIIRQLNINVPIIALSASDTSETIELISQKTSGFNDFLRKPYKNEEFFDKIEKSIQNII